MSSDDEHNSESMETRAMSKTLLVELDNLGVNVDQIIRVGTQHFSQVNDAPDANRAVRIAMRVLDGKVIARMPDTIAIKQLPSKEDVAFKVLEPPDQHLRCNVMDEFMFDPAVDSAVGKNLEPRTCRFDSLALPLDVEGLGGLSFRHR